MTKASMVLTLFGWLVLSAIRVAVADEAKPPLSPADRTAETVSVQRFGNDNKDCAEWSDGCVVCVRGAPPTPAACSRPGIACLPGPIDCRRSAETSAPH